MSCSDDLIQFTLEIKTLDLLSVALYLICPEQNLILQTVAKTLWMSMTVKLLSAHSAPFHHRFSFHR
jgi:hypothetical protein